MNEYRFALVPVSSETAALVDERPSADRTIG
jgi:hypothetical protein